MPLGMALLTQLLGVGATAAGLLLVALYGRKVVKVLAGALVYMYALLASLVVLAGLSVAGVVDMQVHVDRALELGGGLVDLLLGLLGHAAGVGVVA